MTNSKREKLVGDPDNVTGFDPPLKDVLLTDKILEPFLEHCENAQVSPMAILVSLCACQVRVVMAAHITPEGLADGITQHDLAERVVQQFRVMFDAVAVKH